MASGRERRRHKRVGVTWTVQAVESSGPPSTVEIVNVSESGLGVVSFVRMEPSARYQFRLQGWTEAPLEGVVRWAEIGDVRTYAGIEFVAPSDRQLAALRELIARFDEEDWGG